MHSSVSSFNIEISLAWLKLPRLWQRQKPHCTRVNFRRKILFAPVEEKNLTNSHMTSVFAEILAFQF